MGQGSGEKARENINMLEAELDIAKKIFSSMWHLREAEKCGGGIFI